MDSNLSGDKLRSPHVSWVFAQLVTFPISGPGATFGWPSQSRLRRASVSAAASVGRWATSHRDVAAPKGEPSRCATGSLQKGQSRLPLWGALVPSGHRLALSPLPRRSVMDAAHWAASPEPAGESAPAGGGEGNPPPARTCAILLMSTSGASCHGRELTAEALRRPGKALRCFPSFSLAAAQ